MRKLIYTLFYCILLSCDSNNSQETQNSYNLDVARELGLCYDDKKIMPGGEDFYYPLCSDSSVRVFFLEPNYYVTYVNDIGSCGSCGCHMELFKKEENNYKSVDIWHCCSVDLKQTATDYILVNDGENGPGCWTAHTLKIKVRSDRFYIEEITDYYHKISDNHADFCFREDSLWLIDTYKSENRLTK
tara:strand:+ start:89 stop:649 length:561 start_codon:yes stop_codon:yes gene_type:complete